MIKCRINDEIEITVAVDVDKIPTENIEDLIKKTAMLACEYAKTMGLIFNEVKTSLAPSSDEDKDE